MVEGGTLDMHTVVTCRQMGLLRKRKRRTRNMSRIHFEIHSKEFIYKGRPGLFRNIGADSYAWMNTPIGETYVPMGLR